MDYDFSEDVDKIWPMLIGIGIFAAVVIGLLLVLDVLPRWGRNRWHVVGFLGPAALLLLIGLIIPAIRTTYLSFFDQYSQKFVGIDNYAWIFQHTETLHMLRNTLLWVLFVPTLSTAVGLLYAVLVDKARFEGVAKSLIFMPMAISLVGASIIWKFVYAYRSEEQPQIGLFNQIRVWLGLKPEQLLLDPPINTLYMVVIMIWIQAGFAMVVLSAAIKAIPSEITEAAKLDGASAWQMFWRVTLPSIRPAVVVVVMTITIATLKVFDVVRTTTGGQFDTNVLAYEMYNQAFRAYDAGKGAALAVFLFVLVVPIVFYQVKALRRQRLESR
jgi:alpha-glucoside transport system permease protein